MVYPRVLQVPQVSHDTEFDSVVFTCTCAGYSMLRYRYCYTLTESLSVKPCE